MKNHRILLLFMIVLALALGITAEAGRPPCRIVVNESSEYVVLEGYNPLGSFRADTVYTVGNILYWVSCDDNFVCYDPERERLFVTIPGGYIECENYKQDSLNNVGSL